jgi:hypothetical protein
VTSLDTYLETAGAAPWRWGTLDCTLFVSGWVLACTGIDPAAAIRERYSDAEGARGVLDAHGGLLALVAPLMDAAGFSRTNAPQSGDVGIVEAPVDGVAGRHVAAIRQGRWWVVKGLRGMGAGSFPTVAAWSIPQR